MFFELLKKKGSQGLQDETKKNSEHLSHLFTRLSSAIDPVTTISADYSCTSGMVTVTWDLVFGANSYKARAVDSTGASNNCTSASTSCQITMLKCGETYVVRVTAFSDDCESISNTTALFETGERSTCSWGNCKTWLVFVIVSASPHASSPVCVCFPHVHTFLFYRSLSSTLTLLESSL